MDIEKIKNDRNLLEKILLAYWYSMPFDNSTLPDKVSIKQENRDFYNVEYSHDNIMYGVGTIHKSEINKYFDKLKDLKVHELDIIKRLDDEVKTKKERAKELIAKKKKIK